MSNQLALATVTTALKFILDPAMELVPGAAVTTQRPDKLGQANLDRGVNVFLYRITPDPTFRNLDVPTRHEDGSFARVPVTPVSLHYLVTAYGDDSRLESQLLLGAAIGRLNKLPVLTGSILGSTIAEAEDLLSGSDLDEQKPRVSLSMETLSDEGLSKIWSVMFQTSYQLSVSFKCTPVLLHSDALVTPRAPADINLDVG